MVIGRASLLLPNMNTKVLPIVFNIELWTKVIKLEDVVQWLSNMRLHGICSLILT